MKMVRINFIIFLSLINFLKYDIIAKIICQPEFNVPNFTEYRFKQKGVEFCYHIRFINRTSSLLWNQIKIETLRNECLHFGSEVWLPNDANDFRITEELALIYIREHGLQKIPILINFKKSEAGNFSFCAFIVVSVDRPSKFRTRKCTKSQFNAIICRRALQQYYHMVREKSSAMYNEEANLSETGKFVHFRSDAIHDDVARNSSKLLERINPHSFGLINEKRPLVLMLYIFIISALIIAAVLSTIHVYITERRFWKEKKLLKAMFPE